MQYSKTSLPTEMVDLPENIISQESLPPFATLPFNPDEVSSTRRDTLCFFLAQLTFADCTSRLDLSTMEH
jgi:hypothetical protein